MCLDSNISSLLDFFPPIFLLGCFLICGIFLHENGKFRHLDLLDVQNKNMSALSNCHIGLQRGNMSFHGWPTLHSFYLLRGIA